ncbi:RNA polymerase sigma factor SigZ [Thalassotalea atypica]|uniref:RNA polymerase sigma factor SigZ n=1 Tax=Thalassotalea atypica TaxID=2054316 RepID=UPI002573AF57|nr:RNA polymerase sigma factor SigZ [Thalassotalea atypica]
MTSLDEIWSQYHHALARFLHAKVSDPAMVEDLLQEILLKTYSNLSSIKDQKNIKSWLFQIANRTIIDFYRKQSKVNAIATEALWYNEKNDDVHRDLSQCLIPFINALPDEMARLLTEIELGNKSQKQYAEELGVSYSTLKSRVQKARTMLRELFEGCCNLSLDKFGNVSDFEEKHNNCKKC